MSTDATEANASLATVASSSVATMTDTETYNGYANRETWAFNLHWQNDQGLYNETLEYAGDQGPSDLSDSLLGDMVVAYWRDLIDGWLDKDQPLHGLPDALRTLDREVGSWWRIDYAEVGAAVRESLDAES